MTFWKRFNSMKYQNLNQILLVGGALTIEHDSKLLKHRFKFFEKSKFQSQLKRFFRKFSLVGFLSPISLLVLSHNVKDSGNADR